MVVGLLSIFQGPASTPLFIKHSFIGFMIFQPVTHLMLQIILCPRSAFSCEFADKVYIQIILLIQGRIIVPSINDPWALMIGL